jgi:hypothetical protein
MYCPATWEVVVAKVPLAPPLDEPVMVMGVEPMMVKVVQEAVPAQVTVVVPTDFSALSLPRYVRELGVKDGRYRFPETVWSEEDAFEKTAVDEANKEYGAPLNQTGVVVEFAFCPKLVSWMNG